jgi:hypothetical protein
MEKDGEPEAELGDNYIFLNFMERTQGDLLKWPKRADMLNMLKDDVLFTCQAPIPCAATSSSRSTTFSLTKSELNKAKHMFMLEKAYYPTKNSLYTLESVSVIFVVCAHVLCVCVCLCVVGNLIWWDNNFRARRTTANVPQQYGTLPTVPTVPTEPVPY